MTKRDDCISFDEMGKHLNKLSRELTKDYILDEVTTAVAELLSIRDGYKHTNAWYDGDEKLRIKSYFGVLKRDKEDKWQEEFVIDGVDVKYDDGTESFVTDMMKKLLVAKALREYEVEKGLNLLFGDLPYQKTKKEKTD